MALWGKTDTDGDKPKYLSTTEKALTFFVDQEEAQLDVNRAKGLSTPGWVRYVNRTDSEGNERHIVEVLVAMRVPNADAGDAAGDTTVGNEEFAFTTQPVSVSVEEPAEATFTVAVAGTNTYQWQVKVGTANYVNASGAEFVGATTDTLVVTTDVAMNGNKFRCLVLNQTGDTSITSKPATLTVTAP